MRASRLSALFAGLAALVVLTGCFDLEESVDLDRNLAGKAGFSATFDLGAMVMPMLMMQRQMAGKTGEPTAEEIATARQEMAAQQKSDPSRTPSAPKREDIEKTLPPGVRLLDIGSDDADLKARMHASFAFDDLNKLAQIRDPKKDAKAASTEKVALFDRPFAGLKLVDEGKTVFVSTEFGNPVSEASSDNPLEASATSPEAKKTIADLFHGLHLRFKLTTPLEVVNTNATRRDGQTLVWDYDQAAVMKLAESKEPVKIWVRLRHG